MFSRGLACIIFSLAIAWKFAIVFLAFVPFMILFIILMVIFIKKYTIEEFKGYGIAGRISQEILSSIRTVLSLGIHKKAIEQYSKNLNNAEIMSKKKGLFTGIFSGLSNGLFSAAFGIGIYYAAYLVRTDCENYSVSAVIPAFFTMVTSSFSLGKKSYRLTIWHIFVSNLIFCF